MEKDAQVEDNKLTAAEFWSSHEENEVLPMDVDTSDEEGKNLPNNNNVLVADSGVDYTSHVGQFLP